LIVILKGDLDPDFGPKNCAHGLAFSEFKDCRVNGAGAGVMMSVCPRTETSIAGMSNTDAINVRFQDNNPNNKIHVPRIESVTGRGKTLHIYGVGNHPPDGDRSAYGRLGTLNVTAWKDKKWNQQMNEPFFWGAGHYFIWVPPHFKFSIGRPDESNQRGLRFLKESHDFFASLEAPTLNTYTLTEQAMPFFCRKCDPTKPFPNILHECKYYERGTCELTGETWDGFHYGRAMNVWKAHLALQMFSRIATA
jgi:hypothetical protein